ncbi:MAG: hypothetical protein KIG53_07995, partial [Oscillospiraceae bacterium]|nr:hypothetical protein [Oscillospiraceae bacterium]
MKKIYFSNAAKMLAVMSAFLLIANFLILLGDFGVKSVQAFGSSLSNFLVYIVLFFAYVAFNGEGLGYKRERNRKAKSVTGKFKLILVLTFIYNFVKPVLQKQLSETSAGSVTGVISRIVLSLLGTALSYGFVFFAVGVWYFIRDKKTYILLPFTVSAVVFGGIYNTYKFFNYLMGKYAVGGVNALTLFFSDSKVLHILSVVSFFSIFVMLIAVSIYYNKKSSEEYESTKNVTNRLESARSVYNEQGYGIDT